MSKVKVNAQSSHLHDSITTVNTAQAVTPLQLTVQQASSELRSSAVGTRQLLRHTCVAGPSDTSCSSTACSLGCTTSVQSLPSSNYGKTTLSCHAIKLKIQAILVTLLRSILLSSLLMWKHTHSLLVRTTTSLQQLATAHGPLSVQFSTVHSSRSTSL